MKQHFEGLIHNKTPDGIDINHWLSSEALRVLEQASDTPFWVVTHQDYRCTEYKMKLNLFTFRGLRLCIPMTVIGPPVSVDSAGYDGDLNKLISDYKRRSGIFLILNLPEAPNLTEKAAIGETLSSCIFANRFSSVEEYLPALRGSYRRRLKQALKRGATLQVEQIAGDAYTDELHSLYLQVRQQSDYPLETLGPEFFRSSGVDLHAFYDGGDPVAFVAVKQLGKELCFVFGGMEYSKRDQLDLHYNMLLLILRLAFRQGAAQVNFGQTAEHSKQRVGCTLSKRYMVAFSGNPIANRMLRLFGGLLSYRAPRQAYRCFHETHDT